MTADARLNLVVESHTEETSDILSVVLVDPNGGPLPPFEAGAHIDVHVRDGLTRQYSLCNSPAERFFYRLGILRAAQSRGGSTSLHATLKPGERVCVGLPRNAFHLREGSASALLIGGGIGITPLMAMAHQLHARRMPFALHYFAKSRSSAAFVDELSGCEFADAVQLHFDDEPHEADVVKTMFTPSHYEDVYLCGPSGFMEWITASAISAGYRPERIHSERFAAAPAAGGQAFTVKTARSGVTVSVSENETIAEALLAVGVSLSVSCEQGICGTCLTRVIEGVPEHRDEYQTDAEKATNSHMTPCCSRARSDVITLDL